MTSLFIFFCIFKYIERSVLSFQVSQFFFFLASCTTFHTVLEFCPVPDGSMVVVYRRATLTINIFAFADVCVCARWKQAGQLGVPEKMAVER